MTAYLVIRCDKDGDSYGIFSTQERASEWASKQSSPCVIASLVVDEPDFGNAKVN